jgi:hypothetical protein
MLKAKRPLRDLRVLRWVFSFGHSYLGALPGLKRSIPMRFEDETSELRIRRELCRRLRRVAFIAELHSIHEKKVDLGLQKSDRFPQLLDAIHPVLDRDP